MPEKQLAVVEAKYIASFIIDKTLRKVEQNAREKKITAKLTPLIVRDQTAFAFAAFADMQSKQIQISDKLPGIEKNKSIIYDSLSANKILKKPRVNFGISNMPQPIEKKNLSKVNRNSLRNDSLLLSNNSAFFGRDSMNKSIVSVTQKSFKGFEKLSEINQQNKISQQEETEIKAIQTRKFFLQEQIEKQRIQKEEVLKKAAQLYESKVKALKNYGGRFNFDYNGETMQIKNTFFDQNLRVESLKTVCHEESVQKKIRTVKSLSQNSHKIPNPKTEQLQKDNNENILLSAGIDPIAQLNQEQISEGVKLEDKTNNIVKQKFRRRAQSRMKTLKQFKQTLINHSFKQFTLNQGSPSISKIKKERAKTVQNNEEDPRIHKKLTVSKLPNSSESTLLNIRQHGNTRKRIKSEKISLDNSIGYSKSILNGTYISKASFKTGKITIDNNDLFQQIIE